MQNFDGGLSNSFSPDPQVDLRGKGPPWPVYLAVGLLVVVGAGFLGFRSYQTRQQRKLHVAFIQQFADFEQNDVNAFWRCLFGKEADPRMINNPDNVSQMLEKQLMIAPKEFPDKVQNECKPKMLKAAKAAKDFQPPPPLVYDSALETYGRALAGVANSIDAWAEGAPKRVESMMQERTLKTAGDAWSGTQNPRKPDDGAVKYDRFLRCAVPGVDKMKEGQELLVFLAGKCVGSKTDPAYLAKLRDTCVPQVQEAAGKPVATFGPTLVKLVGDFDRETQAWDACFRAMRKLAKKDDLQAFVKTWIEAFNASSEVRKLGKEHLKDE